MISQMPCGGFGLDWLAPIKVYVAWLAGVSTNGLKASLKARFDVGMTATVASL
jgi:hypothetical protein